MQPETARLSPDLSIVLPAFDEEARLPAALDTLARFCSDHRLQMEVIVVDDGSTDGTVGVAQGWNRDGPGEPALRVLTIAHRGKGGAVRAGIAHARGRIVGYCDVDMSAGPVALGRLLETVRAGADVAIASRGLRESVLVVRQPWYREQAGRLFNLVLRKVTGVPYRDTQCGMKLFRAEAAREIFRHQRVDGFAFDAEVVLLADRLGFKVAELPVTWSHDSRSKLSFARDGVDMLTDIVRIVRRLRRAEVHALGVPMDAAMDQMLASENEHWWHIAKRRLVLQLLDGLPSGHCLDIGCGGGAMLAAASKTQSVVGIDLAPRALEHARGRGLSRLVCGEAGRLPFESGSFNAVLALDVIEHHARPEVVLAEALRVLASNGRLIVTVPAFRWMWSYADHILGHYRRYTRAELERELRAARFLPERLTYFHSWLLPLAWLFRKLRPIFGRADSADDFALPGVLNRLFLGFSLAEFKVLAHRDLPFGLSVLAVASPAPLAARGSSPREASTVDARPTK